MDVDNVLFDDPTHLPVGSPPWGQAQYARYEYADFTLYLGRSNATNESTFPVSSIQVTVPEPAAAGAILLSLCALALLRERELIRRIASAGRHRSA